LVTLPNYELSPFFLQTCSKKQHQPKEKKMKTLMAFFKDEEGATAVEYAIMVALIAVVIIGAVKILGENASTKLSAAASALN
jgi:pilus assembly protein Flp/PilA